MTSSYADLPANLPANWPATSDWTSRVGHFFASQQGRELVLFVTQRRATSQVYPECRDVFNAFVLTSFANTKVVILGQDPYHGPGQAHGLSFSVREGIRLPPSLNNIFKELSEEFGISIPDYGNLESWARQGVLLLNTVLTVDAGRAGSHRGKGWEEFTDQVIAQLNQHPRNLVFVLWGKPAQQKIKLIDSRHATVVSPHPSPLSAHRGFIGSRPFSQVNRALNSFGQTGIDWLSVCESTSKNRDV